MKNRIIFGGIMIAILLVLTLYSAEWFQYGALVIAFLALHEVYDAIGLKDSKWLKLVASFLAGFAFFGYTNTFLLSLMFFLLIVYLFSNYKLSQMSGILFLTAYITFPIAMLSEIRSMDNGIYLVWFPLFGAFVCDIFAIFAGLWFGKKKLMPSVSPKKTIAGAVGGIVGVVLSFVVFAWAISSKLGTPNWWLIIGLAVVCGVFSQLGDLTASRIKREFGIKDYGNLIPGHGGIMDRCDSIMFVTPIVYIVLTLSPLFV